MPERVQLRRAKGQPMKPPFAHHALSLETTMTDTAPTPTDDDLAFWAVVEIMGHRTRAGRLSDHQIGGATLLRIDHPTDDRFELYNATAIFAIRPCTRDVAARAAQSWPAPAPELPMLPVAAGGTYIDDDDVELYDDDVF